MSAEILSMINEQVDVSRFVTPFSCYSHASGSFNDNANYYFHLAVYWDTRDCQNIKNVCD